MHKRYILLAVALVWLSGCAVPAQNLVAETAPLSSAQLTEPQTECTTIPVTEPTETQTPTEDISIDISAGSHLMTYHDDVLQDYMDYYLFIPENASKHMPLVIFLHGDGEVGKPEILENYGLIKRARELYGNAYPFISISPCTRIKSWTDGSIPELLIGLINEVMETFQIDNQHVIITGHSRGAAGVWHMISIYGDFFSASVPISSPPQTSINNERCILVPTRAFAGNIGEFERWALHETEKTVSILKNLGGDCEFIVLNSCDHSETIDAAFSQETFDWMLAQERNDSDNEAIQ